jgi:hypothetical protein
MLASLADFVPSTYAGVTHVAIVLHKELVTPISGN